jgi:CRISPR-associated endonuclease/helicase Cas3
MCVDDFPACFKSLTDHDPFPWQERLFAAMVAGGIPDACDIPTGLGKTSVIAIWVLALGHSLLQESETRKIPLRLVYVVDRRVIVDQATDEGDRIKQRLDRALGADADAPPALCQVAMAIRESTFSQNDSLIALSTLRGQLADNRVWCLDPSRPAIVVGTIDMIGSRLLFSGYGRVGKTHRSLQAGLLGQDALIVIDEAHLSPAYVTLLKGVRREVSRFPQIRPWSVMLLSATISAGDEQASNAPLAIDDEDLRHPVAKRRLEAEKAIDWVEVATSYRSTQGSTKTKANPVANEIAQRAARYKENAQHLAVVIYVKTVEMVNQIAVILSEALGDGGEEQILKLTGEMRGHERDAIPTHPIFQKFKPRQDRQLSDGPWFLIATSCAEVGVDLDGDHGICDLSSMDSMIQRFGRINRFGNCSSTITVVVDSESLGATKDHIQRERQYEAAVAAADATVIEAKQDAERLAAEAKTLKAKDAREDAKAARETLKQAEKSAKLIRDAGVDSNDKLAKVTGLDRTYYYTYLALKTLANHGQPVSASPLNLRNLRDQRAWPTSPVCPPLDESRIDDWSLTTLSQSEYRRPLVSYWLRGVIDDETAQTAFCWRADLNYASGYQEAEEMAAMIRVAPQERAVLATFRAAETIKEMARRSGTETVVVIDAGGEATARSLEELTENKNALFGTLAYATIVLPTKIGGLAKDGNVSAKFSGQPDDVVDDQWTRYALSFGTDGQCDFGHLPGNGVIETWKHGDSLRDALRRCANESLAICVNARELNRAAAELRDPQEESAGQTEAPILIAYFLSRKSPDHYLHGDDDLSSLGIEPRTVDQHDADVERYAKTLAQKIGLDDGTATLLGIAGARHDRGKDREWWQKAIGNFGDKPLAKSTNTAFDHTLNQGYRHEFGSLVETERDEELLNHPDRDLILHLIAAHHGYARPHFPARAYDRNQPRALNQTTAEEAMHRFARLQRKYGWWQLAYLEAVLKAADALASRDFSRGVYDRTE